MSYDGYVSACCHSPVRAKKVQAGTVAECKKCGKVANVRLPVAPVPEDAYDAQDVPEEDET